MRNRGEFIGQVFGRDIEPHDDFQCYYTVSNEKLGITLLTHCAEKSENGYFMLLISPKYEIKNTDIIEKDFIFVLDHSGSMAPRRKIKQAKAALRYCVQNLNAGDRFNLILFNKMNEPVLVNVELDFGQIITKELSPSNLPDMFREEQFTLLGRYENHGGTVLKIRGSIANELHEFFQNVHFTELEMDNDFLPQLWAQRRIAELVEQEALNGYNEERRKEIRCLSIEHDVVTPYTRFYRSDNGSWVFVSDDIDTAYTPGNKPKDDAVKDSKRIEYQKRSMHKIGYDDTKTYGRKTFYRHGRVWIDTKYDGQSECKKIVFSSEEYFDLAAHSHELAKYLKLSPSMIICHKGVNYKIIPPRSFFSQSFS